MVRSEVLDLKKGVDSYCISVMRQDRYNEAMGVRFAALETIEEAGTEFEISKELALFLRRKIYAALVAAGFRASAHYTSFGKKESKRYRGR